jgi:hypothetical protein
MNKEAQRLPAGFLPSFFKLGLPLTGTLAKLKGSMGHRSRVGLPCCLPIAASCRPRMLPPGFLNAAVVW